MSVLKRLSLEKDDSLLIVDLKFLQACDLENYGKRVESGEFQYAGFGDILIKEGRHWTPGTHLKTSPYSTAKRYCRKKECYRNCFQVAVMYRELTYCEGRAAYPQSPLAVPHAWLLDPQGQVIEATWDKVGIEYYGIPFNLKFLYELSEETGYAGGVFENPHSPVVTGDVLLEEVRANVRGSA